MDPPLELLLMEGIQIDCEAQRRELERYERAQADKLFAEELQHSGIEYDSLPLEGEAVERDCATSSTSPQYPAIAENTMREASGLRGAPHLEENELADEDLQLALMLSRENNLPPPSLPSPSPQVTHSQLLADRSPNPEIISTLPGTSSPLSSSTSPPHESRQVVDEDFSTAPNSLTSHSPSPTSRSPSPPTLPSLPAPICITPPPPPSLPFQFPSSSPHPALAWGSPSVPSPGRVAGLLDYSGHSGLSWTSDEELARQLQEEEEKGRKEQQEMQAKYDLQLAMEMTRERVDEDDTQLVERMRAVEQRMAQSDRDAQLAQALLGTDEVEEMEDLNSSLAARLQAEEKQRQAQEDLDTQMARALQEEMVKEEGSLVQPTPGPSTDQDEEIARRLSEQLNPPPPTQLNPRPPTQLLAEPPGWWTDCPNCASGAQRKYHLIEVEHHQDEWLGVTNPLTEAGFTVQRLRRIQNLHLYQRLQFEKHSMKNGKPDGYSVNERLLFHTSSASVPVICREGLDQRLARDGRFGTGVYFSDNPKKCNSYWRGSGTKKTFACYVLLGKIKEYPKKETDKSLRREPQGYDSVKGNVTGEDEYIIYNYYRAMPAYVLEYS